ncbi:MAG: M1 family metallopeptidase [Thermodesulfobacteriota bacterium]
MRIERYELHFDVEDSEYRYDGTEKIFLSAEDESLHLNAVGLEIKRVAVNGKEKTFTLQPAKEELSVDGTLCGETRVDIEFSAKISRALSGFYLAKGTKTEMLTTQFESSGARKAFPCVDRPDYKAQFLLSLTIREGLDAISNMPIRSTRKSGPRKTITFEETPRMSTYLLYIGVGQFDQRAESYDGKEVIVAAPKGHLTPSNFPIDIAKESLRFYEDYFAVSYMLPKLHLISVPQFAAGAMENWGAITMREVYMDVGRSTSAKYRKYTAEVIAHEIVHHWFGDLVTMKWWNDLWLNESFATFMAYKVVDQMFPEWESWGDFVISRTAAALTGDSLAHSHPIDVEVNDPNEVAQIFDEISYGKGGSILRMLESYVGEALFRKGIRDYLRRHAYDNAVGGDLWNAIEEASGEPTIQIMESWIKTQGYPMITLTEKENSILLEQEQFFLGEEKSEKLWPIPLRVRRTGRSESILMKEKRLEIEKSGFIKLNKDQTGFYRVWYDENLWGRILSNRNELSTLDLWGMINDLYACLISGKITLARYLDRTKRFEAESDHLVVEEITGQYSRLCLLLPDQPILGERSRNFFRTHLERLGEKRDGEAENISILRGVLSRERSIADREFASKLSALFARFHETDPDMRSAIAVSEALAHNDFFALYRMLEISKSDEDRAKLIAAMGWLDGEKNLGRAIESIRNEEIKKQDTYIFYISASVNPEAREFMVNHLDFAINQLRTDFVDTGTPSRAMEQMIPLLGIGREGKVLKLVDRLKSPAIEKGIEKGIEILRIYSKFIKKNA